MTDIIENAIRRNAAFVCYRKPGRSVVHCFLSGFPVPAGSMPDGEGFLIMPFVKGGDGFFFPYDKQSYRRYKQETAALQDPDNTVSPCMENNGEGHIELVGKGISYIRENKVRKLVLAHRFRLPVPNIDYSTAFEGLCHRYPQAFAYIFSIPGKGIWMGASPELLLQTSGNHFRTVALAGTATGTTPVWSGKEYREHDWVVQHIREVLSSYTVKLHFAEAENIRAGHLWHLQTPVTGTLKKGTAVWEILQNLHPTPAVCGTPADKAFDFIVENERFPREFYTGFLGEWHMQGTTELYVNLRCMKWNSGYADVYAGGGITADSNPHSEWNEVCKKAEVMTRVLRM